jgi:hypothetical protein
MFSNLDGIKYRTKRRTKSRRKNNKSKSKKRVVKRSKSRRRNNTRKSRKRVVKRSKSRKRDGGIEEEFMDIYSYYKRPPRFPNKDTKFKRKSYSGVDVYGIIRSDNQKLDPSIVYIFIPNNIELIEKPDIDFPVLEDIPYILEKLQPYVKSYTFRKDGKYYSYTYHNIELTEKDLSNEMDDIFNIFKNNYLP